VLIVVLLIVAISFSMISVLMNLSLGDFERISDGLGGRGGGVLAGVNSGGVYLTVEGNPDLEMAEK